MVVNQRLNFGASVEVSGALWNNFAKLLLSSCIYCPDLHLVRRDLRNIGSFLLSHPSRSYLLNIAIVGAGVSGLVAARLLSLKHDITLYEADDRPGGHAHTHTVEVDGESVTIDTGFMVFNERTYPLFCRLLEIINVRSKPSDMSFSVRSDVDNLEYEGGSLNGIFSQRTNIFRLKFYRLLADIIRFNRLAKAFVASTEDCEISVGDFLKQSQLSETFFRYYLRPMTAAIWSAKPATIKDFPAHFLFRFYENHGLLQIKDRPQWLTIEGGSKSYVLKLIEPIRDRFHLATPVQSIRRVNSDGEKVLINSKRGDQIYDAVIMASHADQSLRLLSDADETEQDFLKAFPYQENEVYVHTCDSVMPKRKRAWASWNYQTTPDEEGDDQRVQVTYHLNRIQACQSPQPIFVTLNPIKEIDPNKVIKKLNYAHPCYEIASIKAQEGLDSLQGYRKVYYAGAYTGAGFHEDGTRSAVNVAKCFGIELEDLASE